MIFFVRIIRKIITPLTHFLAALFGMRLLVLILLIWGLYPSVSFKTSWLDGWLLDEYRSFLKGQDTPLNASLNILHIELNATELAALQRDQQAPETFIKLTQLLRNHPSALLQLPKIINTPKLLHAGALSLFAPADSGGYKQTQTKPWLLDSSTPVLVDLYSVYFIGSSYLNNSPGINLLAPLYPQWWPSFWRLEPEGKRGLLYDDFQPALPLFIMQRLVASRSQGRANLSWRPGGELILAGQSMPLSAQAQVIALGDYMQPANISLTEAVSDNKRNRLVNADVILISDAYFFKNTQSSLDLSVGLSLASLLDLSLQQLHHARYLYEPWWKPLAEVITVVLMALYLFVIVPRLRFFQSLVSTGFGCILLVVLCFVSAWFYQCWLSIGLLLQVFILTYILMLAWSYKRLNFLQVREHCERTSVALARLQIDTECWDELLQQGQYETFKIFYRREQYLASLYRAVQILIVKKDYRRATRLLLQIRSRKRRYKDVLELLKNMPDFSIKAGSNFDAKQTSIAPVMEVEEVEAMYAGEHKKSAATASALTATIVLPVKNTMPAILGRYEVEREIGRGAMGVVYLGRDPKIARQVAIKTVNFNHYSKSELPVLRERFFREAKAAGRLRHPNIVTVYDVGDEDDLAFIAMDYIPGNTLADYCDKQALLPIKIVYEIVVVIAEALEYAHSKKVIHRDIKPENILFNIDTGLISVSDFGIARIGDNSKTKTGDVLGSPLYMAPEQLRGKTVSPAADIFSLGVTFYQLLTGLLPFQGENLAQLTHVIVNNKHIPVRESRPELPSSATRIINKALQKDPKKRYANAEEMAQALRNSLIRDFKK